MNWEPGARNGRAKGNEQRGWEARFVSGRRAGYASDSVRAGRRPEKEASCRPSRPPTPAIRPRLEAPGDSDATPRGAADFALVEGGARGWLLRVLARARARPRRIVPVTPAARAGVNGGPPGRGGVWQRQPRALTPRSPGEVLA